MNVRDLGLFLLPLDLFQSLFFMLIFGIATINIIAVRRVKKNQPFDWESAWKNHTDSDHDDLDAEHGSVVDLSQIVAHPAERWAEIIPGILLVIGLLGTFVGIGIALNRAAGILNSAQSVDGTVNAIKDMLPMLEGLGVKFKTSTWGIIGFLILKAWYSTYGTEEERLRWCIIQSRNQLLQQRADERKNEELKIKVLIDSFSEVGEALCRTMKEEITANRDVLNQKLEESQKSSRLHAELIEQILLHNQNAAGQNEARHATLLQAINSTIDAALCAMREEASATRAATSEKMRDLAELHAHTHELMKAQGEIQQEIRDRSGDIVSSTRVMTDNVRDLIESNKASATQMGNASLQIAESAMRLDGVINQFSQNVSETLEKVNRDLEMTLSTMSSGFKETMDITSSNLSRTIESSSSQLEATSSGIQRAVDTMSGELQQTLGDMNRDFARSMMDGSRQLQDAMADSSSKLHEMNASFSSAMQQGSDQLKTAMEKSSEQMQSATSGIRETVQKMSDDVAKTQEKLHGTLDQVRESIKDSGAKQARILSIIESKSNESSNLANEMKLTINDSLQNLGELLTGISRGNNDMSNVVSTLHDSIAEFNVLLKGSLPAAVSSDEG